MLTQDHALVVGQPGLRGMQVDGLVRLEDPPPRAVIPAQLEVHRAEALDGRAPHRRDDRTERGEALGGMLVGCAGRLAHHPGDFGGGVPELEPAFIGADVVAPQGHRPAPGELRRPARVPPRLPGASRGCRRGLRFDFHLGPPCRSSVARIIARETRPRARRRPCACGPGGVSQAGRCTTRPPDQASSPATTVRPSGAAASGRSQGRNAPRPAAPDTFSPSQTTSPRESTVPGQPRMRIPSYGV